jgi:hypothetical protein
MVESEVKPSLEATKQLTESDAKRVSTQMFGTQQFLDYEKFRQLCFADRLRWAKAELLAENAESLEAEIQAISTQEELRAFVERPEVELTHNAFTLAVTGGDLFRIDNVRVFPEGHLTLNWAAKGQGFGGMRIYVGKDGKPHIDSECMGRHFIRSVLLRLADELIIDE